MKTKHEIELVPAGPGDCECVYALITDLTHENYDREIFEGLYAANCVRSDVWYFMVSVGGASCGFVSVHFQTLLHHNAVVAEIQELIIQQRFRSQGIGGTVLQLIRQMLRGKGVFQLELCTRRTRERAGSFYRSLGFQESHYKYTMLL